MYIPVEVHWGNFCQSWSFFGKQFCSHDCHRQFHGPSAMLNVSLSIWSWLPSVPCLYRQNVDIEIHPLPDPPQSDAAASDEHPLDASSAKLVGSHAKVRSRLPSEPDDKHRETPCDSNFVVLHECQCFLLEGRPFIVSYHDSKVITNDPPAWSWVTSSTAGPFEIKSLLWRVFHPLSVSRFNIGTNILRIICWSELLHVRSHKLVYLLRADMVRQISYMASLVSFFFFRELNMGLWLISLQDRVKQHDAHISSNSSRQTPGAYSHLVSSPVVLAADVSTSWLAFLMSGLLALFRIFKWDMVDFLRRSFGFLPSPSRHSSKRSWHRCPPWWGCALR